MEPLNVGVVEGDEIFRRGLVAILTEEEFDCVLLGPERESSPEAISAERDLDVAVVCSESLGSVRLACPIVVLMKPEIAGQEVRNSETNVMATVPHEGLSAKELVASARAAAAGLWVESPTLSRREDEVLDARRIEVLKLVAQGSDTRAIARKLRISERTVKTLVRDIQLTLGATNRAQAVAKGMRLGLV
ncbi:MAG: response regulator transcription factor [Actinomycetota bacterium]